MLEGSERKGQ